jgi:signal transduction histidine kinase
MKLNTRFLLVLLPTVGLVMSAYGTWGYLERERLLRSQAERETQAYAVALDLAFEYAFRDIETEGVQGLIDELSRNRSVYAIIVYGLDGHPRYVSDPLRTPDPAPEELLRLALDGREITTFERQLQGRSVYSILRTLRAPTGAVIGAIEVAQPLAFIDAEKAAVRKRYLLNTLTLLAALTVATLWLGRRVVASRLEAFIEAVRVVGAGRDERAPLVSEAQGADELVTLAREFNAMTARLADARDALIREGEQRAALESRLRRSEKLATVGTLAAGIAHEIAAPLNVISGRAELLLKHEPPDAPRARHLRIIVDEIGRITAIVRGLLDHARRREPRLVPVELGAVLDGAVKLLEGELARARVRLVRDVPAPAWTRGDADQLHQVFVNLMLNAVQAMESDGASPRELRIGIARADRGATSGDAHGSPRLVVEVEDSGPGLPDEALATLFTPFASTKPRGTGLGLVVARSIVEEHGGTLEGHNRSDGERGAVFRLTLPELASEVARG